MKEEENLKIKIEMKETNFKFQMKENNKNVTNWWNQRDSAMGKECFVPGMFGRWGPI